MGKSVRLIDRDTLLDLFDEQKEAVDARIAEGIEKYRKGDASVTVTDANGKPVANAKIKVNQKNHEFRFGANMFMLEQMETEEKNEKYKKYLAETFNMATLPFYWDGVEPEKGKPRYDKNSPFVYRRPPIDTCMEFCEKNGIEPREHALAYDHFFPDWLADVELDEAWALLENRYKEISERYADRIDTIEVTNEMEWEVGVSKLYYDPDFVEKAFKLARKYFPNNKLVVNEKTRTIWNDRGRTCDRYYAYIEAALLKGTPIDAIGMQYHIFGKTDVEYEYTRYLLNPLHLYEVMDNYARLGKPLQITEVTIPAYSWEDEDEAIQAEVIEKLYKIWFSHQSVEQIVYWNLVDGYAHVKEVDRSKLLSTLGDMTLGENYHHGGLFRFDMTPKPAYYAVKNLIEKEWHTETETATDADGKAEFRGFYGLYDVEITVDGKTVTKQIDLSVKKDNKFEIKL